MVSGVGVYSQGVGWRTATHAMADKYIRAALKASTRNLRQHKILLKVLYLKPGLKDTSKGIWTDFLQTPVKYFLGGRYLLQK